MAVALRAYTQATYRSSNSGPVAWPTVTAAGDLAVIDVEGSSTRAVPDGWAKIHHSEHTDTWCKRVTAEDIASPLPVTGHVAWLVTYSGAGYARRTGYTGDHVTPGGRVSGAGSMLHFWIRGYTTAITPTAAKLGTDVRNPAVSKRYSNVATAGPSAAAGYLKLSGSSNVRYCDAFEIVPLAGPSAPTPESPIGGAEVAYDEDVTLTLTHNSSQGLDQQGRQVRIRATGSGTWLYLQADGTIDTPAAQIATTSETATIDAGELTVDTDYEWAVQTEDADIWSAWSATATFSAAARPTVDSIAVSSPAEDLSPVVTVTASTTGAHVATQVRVCAAADGDPDDPIYDSGTLTGAVLVHNIAARDDWTNGASLKAWARVRQAGGLWSDWTADDGTFAVSWTAPAAPSSVTAANQTSGPLLVTVAGVTGVDAVQVQSSTDDGTSWSEVATVAPSGSTATVQRPRTYGVDVRFRARAADTVDDVQLWSTWTAMAADVTPTDKGAYFEDGSSWIAVRVRQDQARVRVQDFSVTYPFTDDAEEPALVDSTPPRGWAGQTTILCSTLAERDALMAWIDAHPVWTFWENPERNGSTLVAVPPLLITLSDGLTLARLAQVNISTRDIPIRWVSQ